MKMSSKIFDKSNVLINAMKIKTNISNSYADEVFIGDEVLTNESDEMTPAKVINISYSNMQGHYYF